MEFSRDRELLERVITEKRAGIYVGIDPTAPSLHIGHMLPFMVLAWAYVYGIRAVWLVGFCFLSTMTFAAGWIIRLTHDINVDWWFHCADWRPDRAIGRKNKSAFVYSQGQYGKHAYAIEETWNEYRTIWRKVRI